MLGAAWMSGSLEAFQVRSLSTNGPRKKYKKGTTYTNQRDPNWDFLMTGLSKLGWLAWLGYLGVAGWLDWPD
jgi:hypothetical protein